MTYLLVYHTSHLFTHNHWVHHQSKLIGEDTGVKCSNWANLIFFTTFCSLLKGMQESWNVHSNWKKYKLFHLFFVLNPLVKIIYSICNNPFLVKLMDFAPNTKFSLGFSSEDSFATPSTILDIQWGNENQWQPGVANESSR